MEDEGVQVFIIKKKEDLNIHYAFDPQILKRDNMKFESLGIPSHEHQMVSRFDSLDKKIKSDLDRSKCFRIESFEEEKQIDSF